MVLLKYKHLFLTVLLLGASFSRASAIYYTQYTISHSLISNNVYNAYRDTRGFMWFATDKGISRFDGKQFKNYTVLDGLGDNEVFGFYEDKARRLWLFTFNGNPCYVRNDTVFNAYNDTLLRKMPVLPFMNAIYSANDTTLYIGYRFGHILKVAGNNISWVIKPSNPHDELTTIYKSNDSLFAIGIWHRYRIRMDKVVDSVPHHSPVRSCYHNGTLMLADKEGIKVWVDNKLVWQVNDKNVRIENVINIRSDEKGNIFVCTFDGLYVFNRFTGSRCKLFGGERISSISQDIYGNYWVASFGNGVYRIQKELDNIRFFKKLQNSSIVNIDGNVFITGTDTVQIYNKGQQPENIPISSSKNFAPLYNKGDIFFFRKTSNTYVFNKKTQSTERLSGTMKWIFHCDDSYVLLTNYLGEILNAEFVKGKYVVESICSLNQKINACVKDKSDSILYLLTDMSAYSYNMRKRELSLLDAALKDYVVINAYCLDRYLLLLTNSNALVVYDIEDSYRRFEIGTGDFIVFSLLDIGNNAYLLKTNKGYYTLSLKKHDFRNPMLQKIEYPFSSAGLFDIYSLDSQLLCNVNGELFLIDKNLVNKELHRPVFFIEQVQVNNKVFKTNHITVNNVTQCDLNLLLRSFHFNNSANNYQYRIISDDNTTQWFRASGDNLNISLNDYGNYKIQVRAITENNIATRPRNIMLVLKPPFYYSQWFRAIMLVFFTALLSAAIYLYNRRQQRIFQNRLNYMKLEQKALNALFNPHFTFNAINNIQSLINRESGENASEYLATLSKLIRQNMENLQFNLIPIEKELTLVENYIVLQNLRFENNITLLTDNNLGGRSVNIPPLLIHTFVENAVVHGYRRGSKDFKITIDLSLSTDDYLIITISDNGIGYGNKKKDYQHLNKTSLGIDASKKRLQKLSEFYKVNSSITIRAVSENNTTGTEVVIILYSKFDELVEL